VRSGSPAFTLVELLMVVAIMAIVMGSLGIAISNMGGPAPQVAAGQVASGLSLARQYAVAKNLETRFIICNLQGATGPGLPPESWRYWTVIQTNRGSNSWTMLKEWEKLPGGVVFLNLVQSGYDTINDPGILGASVGKPHKPTFSATPGIDGSEWKVFESFTNYSQINVGSSTFKLGDTPSIGYRGVGEAVLASGKSVGSANQAMAIRLALGVVTPNNEIILKATNNYFYVETDKRGRVRVRSKESYRLP
jgi:prepilin-type N-terminal cleavage/methylation domain-containing protein